MKPSSSKSLSISVLLCATWFCASSQTLKFEGIHEVKALKRGKEYSINWSGGATNKSINIELHNNGTIVHSWNNLSDDGEETLKISSKLKPGKNYSFKITRVGSVSTETVSSLNVQIKRRIPMALSLSAIAVIPTVVLILSNRDGDDLAKAPIFPRTN